MTVDAPVGSIDERQSSASGLQDTLEAVVPNDGKPDQRQHQQAERQQSLNGSRSVCRICHTDSWAKESLISPCRCKGSLAYVHLSCLERWLNQSCRNYCELCNFRYNALETPRYGCCESLRIWVCHPRNWGNIKVDILIVGLFTVFGAGLITLCLLGSRYFVMEGVKGGFPENWTKGAIIVFIVILALLYCVSVIILIKNHVTPWYRWWQRSVNIRLLLESPLVVPPSPEELTHQESKHQPEQLEPENVLVDESR